MSMNFNSLAIPGIKLNELGAFFKEHKIDDDEAKKLTKYLTAADAAGSSNGVVGDAYVTSYEISFYQKLQLGTEELKETLAKLPDWMLEWKGEGAVDLKELSKAQNLTVQGYHTGKGDSPNPLYYGSLTIGAKEYQFSLSNPNNLEQARLLALRDPDGNKSYLTGSDIPKEFIEAFLNNKKSTEQ